MTKKKDENLIEKENIQAKTKHDEEIKILYEKWKQSISSAGNKQMIQLVNGKWEIGRWEELLERSDILCDYFDSLNIRFRRQEELLDEQKKSEGRAIITPDLLLLDDVRINGIPCAWIDAKHFFGADLRFPRKKTQKQVDRYVNEYGQGAIVYRHGFCETLKLRGAILLDSSPLNLQPLTTFHENLSNSE